MPIRNEKRVWFNLEKTGVNRSDSPRHLAPGEARIVQNFDFDRESKALVGRRGTLTLNDANPLGGQGYDMHWTYNPATTNQYVVAVYDDGVNYKIGVWQLGAGETQFRTLLLRGGGAFNLNRGARVSFVTAYNERLVRTVMYGTNGVDHPFYWDFTHWNGVWTGVAAPQAPAGDATTEMTFGPNVAPTPFRLKNFVPRPWRGSTWAFLRQAAVVELHWSDTSDGRCLVGQGNSGFLQCPMDDFANPLRGCYPMGDVMMVFNIDSVGRLLYTNNPDDPYEYRIVTRGQGAIHQQCIAPWRDKLLFIDKRPPYLFMTNGSGVFSLDPERKIVSAIQDYFDWSSILCTRLRVWNNTALISFDTRNNAEVGVSGDRWMAAISLTRKGPMGNPYFPWGFYNLQSNDILIADEGINVGYAWWTDAQADPTDSNFYVRRLADFFDGANEYGDYNRVGAPAATQPVTYILQTGFWGDEQWKEFLTFTLDGDWEGTPAAGDVLRIRYRCEGWNAWKDILVSNVRKFGEVPFAGDAQGRTIMYRMEFTSSTAIPLIYGYGMTFKTKRIRN